MTKYSFTWHTFTFQFDNDNPTNPGNKFIEMSFFIETNLGLYQACTSCGPHSSLLTNFTSRLVTICTFHAQTLKHCQRHNGPIFLKRIMYLNLESKVCMNTSNLFERHQNQDTSRQTLLSLTA